MLATALLVLWFASAMTVPAVVVCPQHVAALLKGELSIGDGRGEWPRLGSHFGFWFLVYLEFCLFTAVAVRAAERAARPAPAPPWCRTLRSVWFVVTVGAALWVCVPFHVFRGCFLETSEATATKIQPGMTVAEVERVIGGPPGDYTVNRKSRFQKIVSRAVPNTLTWATDQGAITICDGSRDLQEPGWFSSPDGRVDWVTWEPVESLGAQHTAWSWAVFLALLTALGGLWRFFVRPAPGASPAPPPRG